MKLLSDNAVAERYVKAGAAVGETVSYFYLGLSPFFELAHDAWKGWEKEYAGRGFRTISLDDFIQFGGYGISIENRLGKRRNTHELPVFHAQLFTPEHYHSLQPRTSLQELIQEEKPFSGAYELPGTEDGARLVSHEEK